MDRRQFGLATSALLLLGASGKVPRVGFLANHIPLSELPPRGSTPISSAQAFVDGMRELGWHEGRNIQYVWRSAESRLSRHPQLVEELIRVPVDVIVSFGEGAEAAAKVTKAIPIVTGGDKPGDIPIEQPAKVEFHISLRVAKAIGMTIPPAVLLRADKVIQ